MATVVDSYNRGSILKLVLQGRLDHYPSEDVEFLSEMGMLLNDCLQTFMLEAPASVFEREFYCSYQPDYDQSSIDVHPTDAYVFRVLKTAVTWETDGTWKGMRLEVQDTDDRWHQRQVQDVWSDATYYYLSVLRKWFNTTDTALNYRIYSGGVWLPPDCFTVAGMIPLQEWGHNWAIRSVAAKTAEIYGFYDLLGGQLYAGLIPTLSYRGERRGLPAPLRAPTVATVQAPVWSGPESAGTFKFLYTYIHGVEEENEELPLGAAKPKFESAPSPESAAVTAVYGGDSIKITTPEIAWMRGFNTAGTIRQGHGGWKKRIYVARSTAQGGLHSEVELAEVYHHLVDIPATDTEYNWVGDISPNYHVRHRHNGGRQLLKIHPQPTQRLSFRIRAPAHHPPLLHDGDALVMDLAATHVLIDLFASRAAKRIGQNKDAKDFYELYQLGLAGLFSATASQRNRRARRRASRGVNHFQRDRAYTKNPQD